MGKPHGSDLGLGFAVVTRHLHTGHHLHADALEVGSQDAGAPVVELGVHQPFGAVQQRHFQAKLVQRIGGLHAEHPTAHHHRSARTVAAHILADRFRVLGRAQYEGVRVRHEGRVGQARACAGGQHQSVIVQPVTAGETEAPLFTVDARGNAPVQCLNAVGLRPVLRHQVQRVHALGVIDQAPDAHAVVEAVRLIGDDGDVHRGAATAHTFGHAHAGHAIADDDDALQRGAARPVHTRCRRDGGRVGPRRCRTRVAVDRHRPAHHAHAGQTHVAVEAHAAQGGAFVGIHCREVLGALAHGHGVGATDSGAAAVVDLQTGTFNGLQQRAVVGRLESDAGFAVGHIGLIAARQAVFQAAAAAEARFALGARGGLRARCLGPHGARSRRSGSAGIAALGAQAAGGQAGGECEADTAGDPCEPIRRRHFRQRGHALHDDRPCKEIEDGNRRCAKHQRDAIGVARREGRREPIGTCRCGTCTHQQREALTCALHTERLGQEVAQQQTRQEPHEQPPLRGVSRVVVVHVTEDGGARVEVVAVLLAAQARLAVAVAHQHQRRLAVGALDGSERAEGAAPAAAAFEEPAARQRRPQHHKHQPGHRRAMVVEPGLTQRHRPDEQRQCDRKRCPFELGRQFERPAPLQGSRQLVERRHRADLPPQARRYH